MSPNRDQPDDPGSLRALAAEYRLFLVENKRWWLFWVGLLAAGTLGLVFFGSEGVPFVYDLY